MVWQSLIISFIQCSLTYVDQTKPHWHQGLKCACMSVCARAHVVWYVRPYEQQCCGLSSTQNCFSSFSKNSL